DFANDRNRRRRESKAYAQEYPEIYIPVPRKAYPDHWVFEGAKKKKKKRKRREEKQNSRGRDKEGKANPSHGSKYKLLPIEKKVDGHYLTWDGVDLVPFSTIPISTFKSIGWTSTFSVVLKERETGKWGDFQTEPFTVESDF